MFVMFENNVYKITVTVISIKLFALMQFSQNTVHEYIVIFIQMSVCGQRGSYFALSF